MGETTKIAWTDHTFSPWIGCAKVAPECEHCYAATWGKRFGVEWGPRGQRRRTSESNWREPLKWDKAAARDGVRRRVFCASLADVFEDHADLSGWREELFQLIERCRNLDWLLLTKRPENMGRMAPEEWREHWPSHVWAGTSAGTQRTLEWATEHLVKVPAAVRFLSFEPLLGPIDLSPWIERIDHCGQCRAEYEPRLDDHCPSCGADNCLIATWGHEQAERYRNGERYDDGGPHGSDDGPQIHWVIVGGESGPNARPMHPDWPRSIVRQCKASGTATFVKQRGAWKARSWGATATNGRRWGTLTAAGEWHPGATPWNGRTLDDSPEREEVMVNVGDAGADPAEWPADLRIREYPEVRHG